MHDIARQGCRAVARVCLGLGFFLFTVGAVWAGTPDAIPWRHDFARARADARTQGRPIWLQFTGPWCGFCRQMEREAFLEPGIVRSARDKFIPVSVQADLYEDLAAQFELMALPTTLIVLPSGEVLARHEGYADPVEFGAFLNDALDRWESTPLARRPALNGGGAKVRGDSVALAGYCPVAMVQGGRLASGHASLALRHEGREYWFANAEHREVFRKRPDAFLPANRGFCVVNQVDRGEAVAGDPRFGVLYRNRVYLCVDQAARDRFAQDPEKYAVADAADRGYCPHCRHKEGRLVRGLSAFAATHAGRRYLFPDETHREAFLASPDEYVR